MTILFCGGELEDFTAQGTVTFTQPSSTYYRNTYARGTVSVSNPTPSAPVNYAIASFTASSQFWTTARYSSTFTHSADGLLLRWRSGSNTRLRLRATSGSSATTLYVDKFDGATSTTLATSTLTMGTGTHYRLDVSIDYQAAGRIKVYVDQVLFIDYSGDVTISGTTSLDTLHLSSSATSSQQNHWSEVIVCTQDSRTLSLKTLAPDAAGTTNTFTAGAYTDIDDLTASDTDVATSATAGQIFQVNCTGMPTGWANLTVAAVKVVASAARGATGPSKLALGVRTGGTDYYESPGTTLDTGYSGALIKLYELNPVTTVAWTTSEIDALQLAFKSET